MNEWFPIQQHIQLKIMSLMRNCVIRVAPTYLDIFLHYGLLFTWKGFFVIFHLWSYGYSVHALCSNPGALSTLATQLGVGAVFHSPCAWNYYASHLPSCGDDLRLLFAGLSTDGG